MIRKVVETARKFSMFPRGCRVLCALSGGADSTAMLYALLEASGELGISEIVGAHFNHMLRSSDSEADAAFVSKMARSAGIRLYTGRSDIAAEAARRHTGLEETARYVRYEFFRQVCEQAQCGRAATGHTADDNAETVLFNLVRGTGLTGAGGIPPVRGNIVRPLLYVTHGEALDFLESSGIDHVEDSSNSNLEFSRNRIRHRVFPELLEINPRASASLLGFSELARQDSDYISSQVGIALMSTRKVREGIAVDCERLRGLHEAISSRLCRTLCEIVGGTLCELNRVHVASIMALTKNVKPSARLNLPGGTTVRRIYTDLVFCRPSPAPARFYPVSLAPGLTVEIGTVNSRISCSEVSAEENYQIDNLFTTFYIKRDKIKYGLSARPRTEGDHIRLKGRNVTKTLKKLFIELKIPAYLRSITPVISDGDRVVAVPGLGIDEVYAAGQGEPALRVEIIPLEETP
ncbi:tRNA(Ile)-lysidine synthase [Clostridia bacterium]|nr:tRNA(Ile)-lysidine synthase [Clostridia bacterium]